MFEMNIPTRWENPHLEALRFKALKEDANEPHDWIINAIKKTHNIHAGFLFQDLKTLQNICLYISETQNKISDPGWQALGYHLGLNISLLKVIRNNNFMQEDPCYNVLLAYVQYDNASIGKIIESLYKMGRLDVLSRIKQSVNDLADNVLNSISTANNNLEDTSDYDSLPASEVLHKTTSQNTGKNVLYNSETFVRPKVIPSAPFIFQNINAKSIVSGVHPRILQKSTTPSDSISDSSGDQISIKGRVDENVKLKDDYAENEGKRPTIENSKNSNVSAVNSNGRSRKRYGLKILLTFAEDGEKDAENIAKELRKKIENYPAIGVLILKEHSERVNMDPQLFIEGAFHQVDYVCPIITPGYYRLITKQDKPNPSTHQRHMDAYYVPYIYRLMNSYFIANNCLNDKIRCIVSEDSFRLVPSNFLMVNPILGAWVNASEVSDLAERLLKTCAAR